MTNVSYRALRGSLGLPLKVSLLHDQPGSLRQPRAGHDFPRLNRVLNRIFVDFHGNGFLLGYIRYGLRIKDFNSWRIVLHRQPDPGRINFGDAGDLHIRFQIILEPLGTCFQAFRRLAICTSASFIAAEALSMSFVSLVTLMALSCSSPSRDSNIWEIASVIGAMIYIWLPQCGLTHSGISLILGLSIAQRQAMAKDVFH